MDFLSPSLPIIKALQSYGWLAWPMKILSTLGSEPFYLLLLPLVYWNIDRRIGARLGVLLLASVTLNDLFKIAFALPRPFWSSEIRQLAPRPETSFGFPSGHAQSAAALWSFLALQTRAPRRWLPLAFGFLVLISLSRLYLGAHYPLDVVGGALIGYALLAAFTALQTPALRWWNRHSLAAQIALSFGVCLILGGLYWLAARRLVTPAPTSPGFETYVDAVAGLNFARRVGALFGLIVGLALMLRLTPFEIAATRGQKIARFVLGALILLVFYAATRRLLPIVPMAFAGYFALTFWVTLGAPALFVRLGLMQRQTRVAVAASADL